MILRINMGKANGCGSVKESVAERVLKLVRSD